MAVLIFSAFILYDLKQVIDGGETNYVTATLAVYLDVYNVFTSLRVAVQYRIDMQDEKVIDGDGDSGLVF